MMDGVAIPATVDETLALLSGGDYVADRNLATSLFVAFRLNRPLFLEGEAGVGKTALAQSVLAERLGRSLLRLQCYEGLDVSSAVYEWNYARQMIEIRLSEAMGDRAVLLRTPCLAAEVGQKSLNPRPPDRWPAISSRRDSSSAGRCWRRSARTIPGRRCC